MKLVWKTRALRFGTSKVLYAGKHCLALVSYNSGRPRGDEDNVYVYHVRLPFGAAGDGLTNTAKTEEDAKTAVQLLVQQWFNEIEAG